MRFDYFYGNEAEQFTFYRIPKVLVTSQEFRKVSDSAKLLYGLMLDRMGLSVKNGWFDEQNRAYIYFKTDEIMELMCCATEKATRIVAELDSVKGIGLIERIKQGQGKPAKIYLKKFIASGSNYDHNSRVSEIEKQGFSETKIQTFENRNSCVSQSESQEFRKSKCNYNNINNTDINNTEFSKLDVTLSTLMQRSMEEQPIVPEDAILHHKEGVDLIPANIELSGMETALVNVMSRERVLKNCIDSVKDKYDYVLIDCTPSLGMLTINSLVAADEVIIPVQAHYLPLKGLEQLVSTVTKVQRQINPDLKFNGILITMVDKRTLYNKEVSSVIRLNYSKYLKIFKTEIPNTVKAAEASAVGRSVYAHDAKGIAAEAYKNLTKEVLNDGRNRNKHREEYAR